MFRFQPLLIGLLVYLFAHAPIPWVHRHEHLPADQLAAHLQRHHAHCPDSQLPEGWHCHWLIGDLQLEGESPFLTSARERDRKFTPTVDDAAKPFTRCVRCANIGVQRSDPAPRRALYLLYRSLLI